MSVYSAGEGRGCTFTMDIPICTVGIEEISGMLLSTRNVIVEAPKEYNFQESKIEDVRRSSLIEPQVHVTDLTSKLTVLVVDDASLNRKMLCRLIRPIFLDVAEASDGLKAVNHIRDSTKKPDIILMDFVMPNMDGPTATKEIRALGYTGMIIGVTGNALPADIELFLHHGANKVITKPLRMEQLYAAIEELHTSV